VSSCAADAPRHHQYPDQHHGQAQPLSHADTEGHQAEDAIVRVAGEFGEKTGMMV